MSAELGRALGELERTAARDGAEDSSRGRGSAARWRCDCCSHPSPSSRARLVDLTNLPYPDEGT